MGAGAVFILLFTYYFPYVPTLKPQAINWSFSVFSFWLHALMLDIKSFMCFPLITYDFGWFVHDMVPKAVWSYSIEFKHYCTHSVFFKGWHILLNKSQCSEKIWVAMHFGYKTIHLHLLNNWSFLFSWFMTPYLTWLVYQHCPNSTCQYLSLLNLLHE